MRPRDEVAEGILGTLFERLTTVWESLELPEEASREHSEGRSIGTLPNHSGKAGLTKCESA